MSKTVSIDVHIGCINVDVDLEDIDTSDLVEELERRNQPSSSEIAEMITEMFYAFKLGRDDHAIKLARNIAEEHVGGIL